jgi:hypothetical protein
MYGVSSLESTAPQGWHWHSHSSLPIPHINELTKNGSQEFPAHLQLLAFTFSALVPVGMPICVCPEFL